MLAGLPEACPLQLFGRFWLDRMTMIRTATEMDYDGIQRFLEDAYGLTRDFFPLSYPCFWRRSDLDCRHIYLIEEEAQVVSLVRVFPLQLVLDDVRVAVGGIGGVATAPRCRGKGYMGQLLNHAVSQMKAEGFPLSILGGDRHRYFPFGYEMGGKMITITMTRRGLDSCRLEPIHVTRYADQAAMLSQITRAYQGHVYRRERTEREFILNYQHSRLVLYCGGDGERFGYLGLFFDWGSYSVAEFGGDPNTVLAIACQAAERHGISSFAFQFPNWKSVPPIMRQAASSWKVENSTQIKILDLEETLRRFRSQAGGRSTLDIADLTHLSETEQVEALFGTASDAPFNLFVWPLDRI